MKRHTLQLEHFLRKLNVKKYEMQEVHSVPRKKTSVYMSQTLTLDSISHLKQIYHVLRSNR